MKKLLVGSVLAASLALVGCGGDDIEEFIKLDTSKAEAFSAGGDDCDAKAKSVREWRSKNTKKYDEMREKLGKKYKKGPPDKYKEQLKKNSSAVMDAMFKCTDNEAFGKAIDETGN